MSLRILAVVLGSVLFSGCQNKDATPSRDQTPNESALKSDGILQDTPIHPLASNESPPGLSGSQACRECHQERYDTYRLTDHSRSFRRPDLAEEVTGLEYEHTKSFRTHRVDREDQKIIHREWLSQGDLKIPVAAKTIDWVVGSGAFGKSYLFAESHGLFQAPLTYYVSKAHYEMSPGYDSEVTLDFKRQITDQCLFCHVGSLSRIDNNPNHVKIFETAIGCERCHGPGETHVQKQTLARLNQSKLIPADDKICNPGKLDRDAAQAICAQCHLQGNVVINRQSENLWDFKPGHTLGETTLHYLVESKKSAESGFVDHFPQLESSRCYTESTQMTCVLCHDPHHAQRTEDMSQSDRQSFFRQQCFQCHQDDSCNVALDQRIDTNQNQCVNCHMPRAISEVPHASVTNHKIGIYGPSGQVNKTVDQITDLNTTNLPVPLLLNGSVSLTEDEKIIFETLALGRWWISIAKPEEKSPEKLRQLLDRIQALPADIDRMGAGAKRIVADIKYQGATEFKDLFTPQQQRVLEQDSLRLAQSVAYNESNPSDLRAACMTFLADNAFENQRYDDAIAFYENMVAIRRHAPDWYNLGLAYAKRKRFAESETAMQQAIQIDPLYPAPHLSLGKLYQSVRPTHSESFLKKGQFLNQFPQ